MIKSISSERYKSLLLWLKQARNDQGLTMRDLAERIDEPHQFIGKIESGERRLDVFEYLQYCEALSVDACEGIRSMSL